MRGPTQNLGPIGSAVLTVIGYKTNKQTQAKYMYKKNVFLSGLCVSLGNNSLKVFSSHSTGYRKHEVLWKRLNTEMPQKKSGNPSKTGFLRRFRNFCKKNGNPSKPSF